MALLTSHHEGQISITFGTPATALTGATVSGATSLPVTVGTGSNFRAAQLLLIEDGSNAEIVRIASVAANTITLTDGGCTKAHALGAGVALVTLSGPGVGPQSPYVAS